MARRAGKAASRKARQRNTARPPRPAAPAPSADTVADADVSTVAVPPVGTPDARAARSLNPPTRRTVAASTFGSTLTDRERSEYHYVERDLRNIGVLTAIMFALLLLAWVLFQGLGLLR